MIKNNVPFHVLMGLIILSVGICLIFVAMGILNSSMNNANDFKDVLIYLFVAAASTIITAVGLFFRMKWAKWVTIILLMLIALAWVVFVIFLLREEDAVSKSAYLVLIGMTLFVFGFAVGGILFLSHENFLVKKETFTDSA